MSNEMNLCDVPAVINLCIIPGATFQHTITVLLGKTLETATPADYTGATAAMQIRDLDTGEILYEMTTEDGGLTLGGTEGTITFYVDKTVSTDWTWTLGEYESLEITYPSGETEAFSMGTVSVGRELTK